ncbi:MAG: tetratricopeptide repeat protein [Pseudomonadota bacterium]
MRPIHRSKRGLGVVLAALCAMAGPAQASECSLREMFIEASSVIEPCTKLLLRADTGNAERAQAHFVRGRGYYRLKRYTEAANDYKAAAALDPNNEEIWLAWSNIDQRRREWNDYAQKVQTAARLRPESSSVLLAVGVLYWTFGESDKAVEFFSRAIAADPANAHALMARANVYRQHNKFNEAIADLNTLIALPRNGAKSQGYIDYQDNVRDFHVVALIRRGELFQESGQDGRAAKDFEAALVEGQRSADALIVRARFLSRSGPSEESVRLLQEATAKEPGNASAHYALGLEFVMAERFEPALESFDKAIAARPNFDLAYKMRARAYRHFGRTDEAMRDFLAAIEANPATIGEAMPALRHAGYWTSAQAPERVTPELKDAIRACMIDVTCN